MVALGYIARPGGEEASLPTRSVIVLSPLEIIRTVPVCAARRFALGCALALAGLLGLAATPAAAATATQTVSYSQPGSYTFTVPAGVSSLTITATGAPGGGCQDRPAVRGRR
jgi:hypothetical protein